MRGDSVSIGERVSPRRRALKLPRETPLREDERHALDGRGSPHGVIIPEVFE